MADSTFTFRVDEQLKAAFAEVAAARGRTRPRCPTRMDR
jgi:predicted transcriptional regulator